MAESSSERSESNEKRMESNHSNGDIVANIQNDTESEVTAQSNREREKYQPTKLESFLAITKSLIVRGLIIYFITSFFRQPAAPNANNRSDVTGAVPSRIPATNIFENGTIMDIFVYASELEHFADFDNLSTLLWHETGLIYGDWTSGPNGDGTRIKTTSVPKQFVEWLKNNGSLYLHTFVTRDGRSPNPQAGKAAYAGKYGMAHNTRKLNKYKKLRYTKTHNLLTGQTAATAEEIEKADTMQEEIVSHWHPNLTINLVTDQTAWVQGSVPPPLDEYIQFVPKGNKYKPVIFFNDFWNLLKEYRPINKTTEILELSLTYQPLSLFKWQIYSAQEMRKTWTSNMLGDKFGDESDEDQDTLKEALLETSPYLLALTIVVSILHNVFELLAFKNDIQFWNNRKSLEGLSVRSVFFNVFQAAVVFLYVLDSGANFMVTISCFIGLCIEMWKVHKVMDVKTNYENRLFGFLPRVTLSEKGSYVESSTKQYDILAFRYLSWALYPLVGGYAVYSLLYQEHRGWYSFTLNMLYGFLLTFGFIMMTPQLFINYKLKSVAHLPWRMLTYKFLNTIIDDIFAFVIKMPTLYRLGCFRDDIVFCIFVYQRWIYKTDPTRVNEFGFSAEMEKEAASKLQDQQKATSTNNTLAKKND